MLSSSRARARESKKKKESDPHIFSFSLFFSSISSPPAKTTQPDNFLFLYADEESDEALSSSPPPSPVRATDFGLAIRHSPSDPPLTSRTGTPVYMAPEVILQNYGAPADCWVRKQERKRGF